MTKPSNDNPYRVGLLFSETGVTAATEASMLHAALFAIDEINKEGGINGRELVPLKCNPNSDAIQYSILADELLTKHGVNIIFGCYMSSTRKAVLPIVERRNGLLCYPAQYEGFEYSRNVIYAGAVPNQNLHHLANYLLRNERRRFYLVGANYIWPWEASRVMAEMVVEHDGEIVGEKYLNLDATRGEFDALVSEIKDKRPDVIFCNFVGKSITHFYQAYAAAGLDPEEMPIASLTTSETDVREMGVEAAVGHVTSATYFQSIDTPLNRTCVRKYNEWFGEEQVTNMCWEAAYFQVHIVADALRIAGTDDIDILRPRILNAERDAPQGRVRVDPDNGHTYLWPRIGRVNAAGQYDIISTVDHQLKPDPYLASHNLLHWMGA